MIPTLIEKSGNEYIEARTYLTHGAVALAVTPMVDGYVTLSSPRLYFRKKVTAGKKINLSQQLGSNASLEQATLTFTNNHNDCLYTAGV